MSAVPASTNRFCYDSFKQNQINQLKTGVKESRQGNTEKRNQRAHVIVVWSKIEIQVATVAIPRFCHRR